MRIFQRINDIVSANLNEMIERFENPETMLRQAHREMDAAVQEAMDSAVTVIANEKLLAKQIAENQQLASQWNDRAASAVADGDDEFARQAITRKIQHDRLVAALSDEHAEAAQTSTKLRRQLDGLRAKSAEAQRKLAILVTRRRVAQASRQVSMASRTNGSGTLSRFRRMVDLVDFEDAKSQAAMELFGDEDLYMLDDETAEVERELAELKRTMDV